MTLTLGSRLGPYEILSALGAGGMGEVYKARDTRLERTVAVKVLPADLAADAQFRARFDREARAISQLTHPHICTLYDVGDANGTAFLVMELLQGQTLADRLRAGALPLDQALRIAIEIADALATAHRAGIVHRDLKPGNIMLTKVGAKLLDFGLAKAATPAVTLGASTTRDTATAGITGRGAILGTLHYMAPEQLEGREADPRSDIWALGAVLYEMVTGQMAFAGESPAGVVGAILKDRPLPLSSSRAEVPALLDHLVARCLEKDPDERWQSARDVTHALQYSGVAQVGAASGVKPTPKTRALAPWLAAALGATAVVGLAAWTLSGGRPQDDRAPVWLSIAPPAGPFGPRLGPAISPDGGTVAFWAPDPEGIMHLWVRSLSEPASRALPGTEGPLETTGSRTPTWSPDGRSLAFFSHGRLQRIEIAGGNPTTLADTGGAPRGLAWGSQGTIVFVPNSGGGLFAIPAAGGAATPLNTGELSRVAEWPSFLPDGRHFLFVPAPEQTPDESRMGVYLGSVDSPASVRISHARSRMQYATGHVFFVQEDVLYAQRFDMEALEPSGEPFRVAEGVGSMGGDQAAYSFSVADNGTITFSNSPFIQPSQLQVVDRQGRIVRTLGDVSMVFGLALSRDERRLVVEKPPDQKNAGSIWSIDQASGIPSLLVRNASLPVLSTTGDRLLYRTRRNGVAIMTMDNPTDAIDVPLDGLPGRPWPEDWATDGRSVLLRVDMASTQSDLWTVASDGSQPPSPYLRTSANEAQARFSPDGRWVAYTSDESGRDEVYVQSFPRAGTKTRVSTAGGTRPFWRTDGNELYYLDAAGRIAASDVQSSVAAFHASLTRPLFDMTALGSAGPFRTQIAAIRGGDQFLVNLAVPSRAPTTITVLLNWRPPTSEQQ